MSEGTNILIVDDDREIAEAIAFYLRSEGYSALIAESGIEALDVLEESPVDLIIMDIMMPGLDGIQTTRRIREEHNIPIIMLSAKSEQSLSILWNLLRGSDPSSGDTITSAALLRRESPGFTEAADSRSMTKPDM